MVGFEGKDRNYIAHISLSCNGPEKATVQRGSAGLMLRRDGANLRYTTRDVDWLHSHFLKQRTDTASFEKHFRCVNPTKSEFLRTADAAIAYLAQFKSNSDWDGGAIVLVYAGHGAESTGALVFSDAYLEPEEFARYLCRKMPKSARRVRVDLILDSCFSSAFVARFLCWAWVEGENVLFPCTLFAAALPDEYAWEMASLQHGVFTHAYRSQIASPSLSQPKWLLIAKVMWHRFTKRERHRLGMGGVSYITNGEQHSLEYENGHFHVHGAGDFDFTDIQNIEIKKVIAEIKRVSVL